MRTTFQALAALAILVSSAHAGDPVTGFTDTLVIGGLSGPTGMAFLPDGRLLVTEKSGALKLQSGTTASTLVTIPVCSGSEMGLLGIAIDPGFGTNGFVYLYRTENTGGCASATGRSNEVVRVTMASDDTIDIGTLTVLLTGIRTDNGNHDGGALRLGPDGKLYVGVGDTGNGDNAGCPGSSTNPYSQDLTELEGKILRLNLDGSIPADNPFVGMGGGVREEIFARGFRNPFRMGFDPVSDALWVADVGDLAFEEIDIVTAGGNYGWPQCEATFPTGCHLGGETDPIFLYSHDGGCAGESGFPSLGTSITGGTFAGSAFGASADDYVFGDFTGSAVYLAQPNLARDDIAAPATIVTNAGGPVDFARGPDGAVYYVAINVGQVRRVAVDASAQEQELLGSKATIAGVANPAKQTFAALSKDLTTSLGAGNGSADDPVLNGGMLHITTVDGCGGPCDISRALPQNPPTDTWKYIGLSGLNKGYKFKHASPTEVITVTVKPNKLVKMKIKGPLGVDLAADPATVPVRLDIGARSLCLEFGGTQTFLAGKSWKALDANEPAMCLP